jgi:H+/gluconate symporter-like permease
VSVLLGSLAIVILQFKYLDKNALLPMMGETVKSALVIIGNTCAVVGFADVVKATPAFPVLTQALLGIPGNPLISAALGTTLLAGFTGSATAGVTMAAQTLGPIYVAKGVSAAALSRTMSVASSCLDSLPHNGGVVTTIYGVCNETYDSAYKPLFIMSVIVPFFSMVLSVLLFSLFPNWP